MRILFWFVAKEIQMGAVKGLTYVGAVHLIDNLHWLGWVFCNPFGRGEGRKINDILKQIGMVYTTLVYNTAYGGLLINAHN